MTRNPKQLELVGEGTLVCLDFFKEFDSSGSTVRYAERRSFLDLLLGIISVYLNLDCKKYFIP